MAYCWAALRTLGILIGVFAGLFVLTGIASGVFHAFLYTFEVGCLVLALTFSVLALFGHQLMRVSKTPRTRHVGSFARSCGAAGAALALVSFAVDYGYSTIKDSRVAAAHGPWEQYATKKPVKDPALLAQSDGPTRATNPFDKFDTPAQRGTTPGMFDDLIPKQVGARTSEATPNCDDELVSAYRASRVEAAAVPPLPPGYVLDTPASNVGRIVTTRPCLLPVDGDPYAAFSTKTARVFRLGSGWEIHAPTDARDQDVLRIFDALPTNAVLPVKSP
jgi:hypothetical protein